jgi:quinol---cytochrome-c reductase cytochrome c subunit
MRYHILLPPAAAAVTALLALTDRSAAEPLVAQPSVVEHRSAQDDSLGATLYSFQCASCHGDRGEGIADRGPALTEEGPAAVDFVLRTGRMPLAAPNLQARRGPVRFTEEEIVALVEYAGAFGDGPQIPEVDAGTADLAAGGELYRLNCAACHVTTGAGAAIGGGREAPSLMSSSPTEIGEAILVGPGAMPTFQTFTAENIDDVAAYIDDLQRRKTTDVADFGGAGPVAEGLAAWLLGLIPLIALTRWIGTPHEGRDTHAVAAPDDGHAGES